MEKMLVLCVCFCGMAGLLGAVFWNNKHPPGGMKGGGGERGGWLSYFYPTAYVIHSFWRHRIFPEYPEEKIKKLQQIQIGKSREEMEEFYDCQKIGSVLFLMILTVGFVMLSILGESSQHILQESCYLIRGEPGEGNRQVQLEVETKQEKKKITMIVPERQYRREELEARFAEAKTYIKKRFLGDNKSSEKITKPLHLVSQIPDSQIKIKWRLDCNGYVNEDGSLNNEELQEETEVLLIAVLSYGKEKEELSMECMIHPCKQTDKELFWAEWMRQVEYQKEETAQEKKLSLPQKIAGIKLSYQETEKMVWPKVLSAGIILCILLPVFLDYQTEQRVIKRERELQRKYPEIVERFILLIGAGLTIRGAWYRITDDYQKRCQKEGYPTDYLYEEMLITRREMENGQNETAAYTAFGRRLSLMQYMKFSTLLVQNLKKGSDDLLKRMDLEAADAIRERRELAKKLGEEAGTKLLFPMMIMLIIVFAMILIAAFYNM